MGKTISTYRKFAVKRILITVLIISIFICFFNGMRIEKKVFNDIEDSQVYLASFPDALFMFPFSGEVYIEKRNFNGSVVVSGKCDSIDIIKSWLEKQSNVSLEDALDYFSKRNHASFDLPPIRFQDKNNEQMVFNITLYINNGEVSTHIESYYPQRR